LGDQFDLIFDTVGTRDLIEIAILTVVIYALLRFLSKTRGSGVARGLGLVTVGLILAAQVVIAEFDLAELAKVLDYLLTTILVGLLVIFQPELRRGLMVLGRYQILRFFTKETHPIADILAEASEALARECVGALMAIQREVDLMPYVETGERIDGEISASLLRTVFSPRSPLHDGAVILGGGRITAAGCQLPLGQPPEGTSSQLGMRHRAALGLSDETDAVVLVVSEESGQISLAVGGKLEAVPRENLSRRLARLMNASMVPMKSGKRAA
jgi:diadenylate cyclase